MDRDGRDLAGEQWLGRPDDVEVVVILGRAVGDEVAGAAVEPAAIDDQGLGSIGNLRPLDLVLIEVDSGIRSVIRSSSSARSRSATSIIVSASVC